VNAAAAGGGFARPEAQLVREEIVLDEKGFADIAKELGRTNERIAKIRDDAAKRLAKSDDSGRSANAVLMLFEASSGEVEAHTNGSASKPRARARR
jgi:hypothetical protein